MFIGTYTFFIYTLYKSSLPEIQNKNESQPWISIAIYSDDTRIEQLDAMRRNDDMINHNDD